MKKESEKQLRFLERLRAIERRLSLLTGPPPDLSLLEARLSSNRAELNAMRERLSLLDRGIQGLGGREESASSELRACLRGHVEKAAPAIEAKLRDFRNKTNDRVALLEKEVLEQRAALRELRQCSLQTEQTMRKLMKGIDRLLNGNNVQSHSR